MDIKIRLLFPCLLLLINCGNGGDSSSNSPTRQAAVVAPDPDTEEFRAAKKDSHRFLEQATFGPTLADMSKVARMGKAQWIDEQMQLEPTLMMPALQSAPDKPRWGEYVNIWWKTAVTADDQLRQRVAFALSEIFVVSASEGLGKEQLGLANYYDLLVTHAFGNYRELIQDITLNPIMGEYLSMKGNHKPDAEKNLRPDENYARELLQLFSIGPVQLQPNGSVIVADDGLPVPTYNQDVVEGFAHVFTGWHFSNADHFRWPKQKDYINPMIAFEEYHDTGAKTLLNGHQIDAGNDTSTDLGLALDNIFHHPNVGPFLARQLVQRLVTSNPSGRYISDITAVFYANEAGEKGSIGSMIKAILLHEEAQTGHLAQPETFGKLKEPALRVTSLWRAFRPEEIAAEFNYAWARNDIQQAPLNAPSVFNFFTPGFSQPGDIRNMNLVSPEFEIHDESSMIKITNRLLANSIWSHNYKYESDAHRLALNIRPEVKIAERSSEELLDHLNLLLLGGDMSETLRQTALELMANYTSDTSDPTRVIETIFLIVSAPESAIQF